jgi:hypothetical protein
MLSIEYDAENGPLWQARLTRMSIEDEASCQIVNGCVNQGYVLLSKLILPPSALKDYKMLRC